MSSFFAACGEHFSTAYTAHSFSEAVFVSSFSVAWLESSFHSKNSFSLKTANLRLFGKLNNFFIFPHMSHF